MPTLLSLSGIRMILKYNYNWYSVILVYLRLIPSTTVKFRNGKMVFLNRDNYQEFREELFRQYLGDQGFFYTVSGGRTVVNTKSGLKLIIIPDYSNVIDEIFVRNEYRATDLTGRTVIDVGGSVADTAIYFASLGASKVYSFEVNRSRFKIAEENVTLNGMDNIIHMINEGATGKRISEIIKDNHLSHIFLKLDCEGCEYDVVSTIPDGIYSQIDEIMMEYHYGRHKLIQKKLRALGFTVTLKKRIFVREGYLFASRNGKN